MRNSIFILVLLFTSISVLGQKEYDIRTIAFYNLENLFDTINNVEKDDEYSPIMQMKENRSKVYWDKVANLSTVLAQIGEEKTKTSPALIGVCEVENKTVLEDLAKTEKLKDENYGIIHVDSPDKRGIDVALMYKTAYFKPVHYEVFNPNIYDNNEKVYTRDILWVSGHLDGELIHIVVNHWPSRRGGEVKSNHKREKAAYKVTKVIEKIRSTDANAKILVMGDFNDNPTNTSFKEVLKTKGNKKEITDLDMYNPYEEMFKSGLNTLRHGKELHVFDQIIFSAPLLQKSEAHKNYKRYKVFKSGIFNKSFLTQQTGKYKGFPYRSFVRGRFTGGYSDHYPVYTYLIREAK